MPFGVATFLLSTTFPNALVMVIFATGTLDGNWIVKLPELGFGVSVMILDSDVVGTEFTVQLQTSLMR